jgi:nicotinamide-nucleotide adenylyltransferase
MMQIFASDIHSNIASQSSSAKAEEIGIDIGVTKLPYFVDKAVAISESDAYPSSIQQVHLTGFDTLIRILDPKYYPPEKKLSILDPFLEKHRLMVTYRTDDEWGAKQVQDEYLDNLAKGKREQDGGKKEWVTEGRIVMCAGKQEGEETISSTKVREAVKKDDRQRLKRLLSDGVAQYVLKEKLYLETWNKD